jgi:hypothetical protein
MISKLLQYYDSSHLSLNINLFHLEVVKYLHTFFGFKSRIESIRQEPYKFIFKVCIDNKRKYFVKTIFNNDNFNSRLLLDKNIQSYKNTPFKIDYFCRKIFGVNINIYISDFYDFELLPTDTIKIQNIISSYYSDYKLEFFIKDSKYSFMYLFEKSIYALNFLFDSKQISQETLYLVNKLYGSSDWSSDEIKYVCHGDLHDGNIMTFNNEVILIDWEDSMIGPKNYDFIYWLTSFKNHHLINKSFLKTNNIFNYYSLKTFILIILIKSFLSIKNNQILNHKLSIEDRILNVLKIYSS